MFISRFPLYFYACFAANVVCFCEYAYFSFNYVLIFSCRSISGWISAYKVFDKNQERISSLVAFAFGFVIDILVMNLYALCNFSKIVYFQQFFLVACHSRTYGYWVSVPEEGELLLKDLG